MWGGELQISGERCVGDTVTIMVNLTHASPSIINRTWSGLCLCAFHLFKLHITQTTVYISVYQISEETKLLRVVVVLCVLL